MASNCARRCAAYTHFAVLAAVFAASAADAANFPACLANLRGAALAGGVDAGTFDKVTRGLAPNPDVLAMAQVQPEFKTPIWDYLAGLVDEERKRGGTELAARRCRVMTVWFRDGCGRVPLRSGRTRMR